MMKRIILTLAICGMMAGACMAEVPVAGGAGGAAAPVAVNAEAEKALDMLEARGGTLTDFVAELRYSVERAREGTEETNGGSAAYVRGPSGTKLAIQLDTLIVDRRIVRKGLDHQIVFDGEWMIEKDPVERIFRKIQMTKAGGGGDVFSLRGPMPLPIGQKKANVLADFTVEAVPTAKEDPATYSAIKLTPKNEKAYDFSDLVVTVDMAKDVQLPMKISRTGLDGNVTTVKFLRPMINTKAGEKAAAVAVEEPKEEGWKKDVRPLAEK